MLPGQSQYLREAKELIVCWTYDLVVLDPVYDLWPQTYGNSHTSELAGCYPFKFSNLIGSLEWFQEVPKWEKTASLFS